MAVKSVEPDPSDRIGLSNFFRNGLEIASHEHFGSLTTMAVQQPAMPMRMERWFDSKEQVAAIPSTHQLWNKLIEERGGGGRLRQGRMLHERSEHRSAAWHPPYCSRQVEQGACWGNKTGRGSAPAGRPLDPLDRISIFCGNQAQAGLPSANFAAS